MSLQFFSGTIYSNTILSGPVTGLTGSDRTIQIDDVLVPSTRDPSHPPLAINSITVDLSAVPGQSGRFSIYSFAVKSDGTPAPNPVLLDTMFVTFTSPFQLVTFGSGSGTLFTVNPDFTAQPGFGLFYINLEASSIPAAGWLLPREPWIRRCFFQPSKILTDRPAPSKKRFSREPLSC